ncbi:MAG: hypothetical protein J6K84_04370 [Oscillospiraceae bacterium]|nr:hypothetical protein [Oscillospiraceae bacterium]
MGKKIKETYITIKNAVEKGIAWLWSYPQGWGRSLLNLFGKQAYGKSGKGILSIMVVLFACALLTWVGFGLYDGLDTPVQTVSAVEYTAHVGHQTSGYVVRDEKTMLSSTEIWALALGEGQKVSVNEPVAYGYTSAQAKEKQERITELEAKLSELLYAGTDTGENAVMDGQIADSLRSWSLLVAERNFGATEHVSPALKGLVLRRYSDPAQLYLIQEQAKAVQDEITQLRTELSGGMVYLRASESGYFSATVDGFESLLSPQNVDALSVSQVQNLTPSTVSDSAVGRLITGDTWQYLCLVPAEKLTGIWKGDTVGLQFAGMGGNIMEMTVDSISQEEDGLCALVLSCQKHMLDVTALRQQSGQVIFKSYSGLRVPKKAVHVREDGKVGVYVLEGAHARWKTVEILHDNGENYVVTLDKSSTDHLWPGDEIILTAEDISNGKVVL